MALRSFFKYAGKEDCALIEAQIELSNVPVPKFRPKIVGYFSEAALKVLLEQPNLSNIRGIRNRFFMILMYDTAARVSEMLDLKVKDIQFHQNNAIVYLTGKQSKTRVVPIMEKTVEHYRDYMALFHSSDTFKNDDYLFYTTIHGKRTQMSPDNVSSFIKAYGESAKLTCSEIPLRVHPHQFNTQEQCTYIEEEWR